MDSKIFRLILLANLIFVFGGCANKEKKVVIPKIEPPKVAKDENRRAPGSLYSGYDNLFSDDKAHNIGDVVTINVTESISGQGSSSTKAKRSNSMDLSIPSATFMDKKVSNKNTIFGLNQSSSNGFNGSGDTSRTAKLVATITARVTKVYPNGNLYIVGKKYIKINDDIQVLKISGIIRPNDIAQDNSIDSSKISDMFVEYNGKGFMAANQRPGWLADFIMKIWPF